MTIVLNLISELIPIVNLPVIQMNLQLANVIQQSLPYGRSNGSLPELKTTTKAATSQKGIWKRSKPKLEVQIKEEIRVIMSRVSTTTAELYGTVNLVTDQEGDLKDTKLKLAFSKLSKPVSALFHSSATVTSSHPNNFVVSMEQVYSYLIISFLYLFLIFRVFYLLLLYFPFGFWKIIIEWYNNLIKSVQLLCYLKFSKTSWST